MSYKETYKEELQQLKSHLQTNCQPGDARSGWLYFNKRLRLTELYHGLYEECPMDRIETVLGDVNAPVVLLLPSFTEPVSKAVIQGIKAIFKQKTTPTKSYSFHHLAVLSYEKGVPFMEHSEILAVELTVIRPKLILSLMDIQIEGLQTKRLPFTEKDIKEDNFIEKLEKEIEPIFQLL